MEHEVKHEVKEVKTPSKMVVVKLEKRIEINFTTASVETNFILWKDGDCKMVTEDEGNAMRGFTALVRFIEEYGDSYPKVELIRKHEIPC